MTVAPGSWHGWFGDVEPAAALALLAGLYAAVVYAKRKAGARMITRSGVFCFSAGVIVVSIALVSPLESWSEQLFVAHMTQHLLLATVAPPLLVLGVPQSDFALRAGQLRLWRFVIRPPVACALHAVAIWAWHAPALYERALESDALHALEHVSFVGTGVLLWWSILRPPRERASSRDTALLSGIAVLFVTAMQTGALGALLALSRHVLYPVQSIAASVWNLTPLDDQRLAGLVMWVIGGVLYVIMMSVLFVVWLETSDRRRAARFAIGATAGVLITLGGGCGHAEARPVAGGDAERGRAAIERAGCGACHAVPGIPDANGAVGPPLVGIARRAIIGGVLPNTDANMTAWLEDPPAYAPRTTMPNLGLSAQTARDITAYLYSLK